MKTGIRAKLLGRDPWFGGLTTLSGVEGESREMAENQIILDPGSPPAPRDLAGMTNYDTVSRSGVAMTGTLGLGRYYT